MIFGITTNPSVPSFEKEGTHFFNISLKQFSFLYDDKDYLIFHNYYLVLFPLFYIMIGYIYFYF